MRLISNMISLALPVKHALLMRLELRSVLVRTLFRVMMVLQPFIVTLDTLVLPVQLVHIKQLAPTELTM